MKKHSAPTVLFILAFVFSSFQPQADEINKSLLGEWVYEVSEAAAGYNKGSLIFSEKDGNTACIIISEAGELAVSDLKVEMEKITFTTNVDGNAVNVELIMENNVLTGKVDSPEGLKMLKAVKKKE